MPLITVLIVWLGYTTYKLIQEDRCLNQREASKSEKQMNIASTKRVSSYYHEQKPCR